MPKLRVVPPTALAALVAKVADVRVVAADVAATALVVELAASLPVPAIAAVTVTAIADQKVVPNRFRL